MTSRIGQPDTEADIQLRENLSNTHPVSFTMIAGAGSGKTTSLVKALDHIRKNRGKDLKRKGQRVACITYTEVAEKEIWVDVGENPLFHVSTIHSFLWTLVRPFQNDIRSWVVDRIAEKILDAEAKIANTRTRADTKDKARADIGHLNTVRTNLNQVTRFTYGTGSNYENGILGHDDILKMVPSLIIQNQLFRTLIAERFPFVFVDESQDTTEAVVEALRSIYTQSPDNFCLGFFGDPMQKIYATGVGAIQIEPNWIRIEKPENFRCPPAVLSVVNNVRADGDGLVQTQGRTGQIAQGSARLFILPIDEFRQQRLNLVRQELSRMNADPLWLTNEPEGDVRVLVIVHRMAALRLGFDELYSAFNDDKPPSFLKDGFLDGTSWVTTPFLSYLLPMVMTVKNKQEFELISFLRKYCPLLAKDNLTGADMAQVLQRLKTAVDHITEMFSEDSNSTIADILRYARDENILTLEDRYMEYLLAFDEGQRTGVAITTDLNGATAMTAFFKTPAKQMLAYQTYIEDESPFSTQQGIKGAEFMRVLTVLDDDEGSYSLFSYNKYFGITQLSETDQEHITAGEESVIDRTRRLFYVCCSRATKDLGIAFFTSDTELAHQQILASGIFPTADIQILADPIQ